MLFSLMEKTQLLKRYSENYAASSSTNLDI